MIDQKRPELTLSIEEVLALFTSTGEYVSQLNLLAGSDLFFKVSPALQELTLIMTERHIAIYKKMTDFLEKAGVPAQPIFDMDVKVKKPRSGI